MQECFFSSRRLSSGKCIYGAKPRSRFYDAENRLINARNYAASPVTGSLKIDFVYDYQSRRVRRTLSTYTSGAWGVTDDRKFVYQDWNVVAELNPTSNVLLMAYTWGLDLSQSLDGAGGVGGLLAVTTISPSAANFFAAYDGNGNVSEYINSTGAIEAHFTYDPFGQTTVATGTNLSRFVYRFSTKYEEPQIGLYYYGLRYYNPSTGRWPNRDPIEEQGGVNLYGFVGNDSVNAADLFGLKTIKLNVTYDDSYSGEVVDAANRLKTSIEARLKKCCTEFQKACDVSVELNFSNIVSLPRPKKYVTINDLNKVTHYLDKSDGTPVIFTNVVNPDETGVAGVGVPGGLVLGQNSPEETGPHEMGHVAKARYPTRLTFWRKRVVPNPKPIHNPDSDYLMYYTQNSGKVDCEYCTKMEGLAK